MRDEPLNETLFLGLDQARQVIGTWVEDYTASPHSSLGYKPPAPYAEHLTATGHHAAPPKLRVPARLLARAGSPISRFGSNRRWMKIHWQFIVDERG